MVWGSTQLYVRAQRQGWHTNARSLLLSSSPPRVRNVNVFKAQTSKCVKAMVVVEKGVEGGRGRGETMVLRGVHASPNSHSIETKTSKNKPNNQNNQSNKNPALFQSNYHICRLLAQAPCRPKDTLSSSLLPSTTATFAMSLKFSPELRSVVQCQS